MSGTNRRPKLLKKIADELYRELQTQKLSTSKFYLGEMFENAKMKVRLKLDEHDQKRLCMCLASAVVDADHLVRLTEKRDVLHVPQKPGKLEVRGR